VTDTTGIGTLDAQRLELLRRKMAERGLTRLPVEAAADVHQVPEMSDGQRRMWFVQSVGRRRAAAPDAAHHVSDR